MSSIPAVDGLVLGGIVHPTRLEYFQKLKLIEAPVDDLEDHLDSITESTKNLESIYQEMQNMEVAEEDLAKIQSEIDKMKKEMVKTAIQMGNATIICQNKLRALRDKEGAKLSDVTPASPIDWSQTDFKYLPLSADSMELDVHYFKNEDATGKVKSHNQAVSNHISRSGGRGVRGTRMGGMNGQRKKKMGKSAHNQMLAQQNEEELEGTIIFTADCEHKNAVVMDPLVLNPIKAVQAWNIMFPTDQIQTDPKSIYSYALAKTSSKSKRMHILTGATMGSSFVGMVHLLKSESNTSKQSGASLAKQMRSEATKYLVMNEQSGSFGGSDELAQNMQKLVSESGIKNQCNLVTEGIIPNISSSKMMTSITTLKPSPKEVMEQLSVIQGASSEVVNQSMEGMAEKAKKGGQFMKLNSDHLKNAVSTLSQVDRESNRVIDMNSMMSAFTDYVEKATNGKAGTPTFLTIKGLTKKEIASTYIQKYYPNGISTDDESAMQFAQMGIVGKGSSKKSSGDDDSDNNSNYS